MKEESPPIEQESSQLSSAVPSPTEKSRKVERSSFLSMVHIVAVGLPLLVIWFAQPGTSLFSWHPTLMTLSFGFLMFEAILMFSPQSSLILSFPRATKIKFHWILQTAAVIFALGGFAAIYINKNMHNKPHFQSWHGLFGFCTVILICLQSLQGVAVLYPKWPLARKMKPRQLKQLHAVCGSLVFLVACATLGLGFYSNWFTKNVHVYVQFCSVLSCIAFAGIVTGQVYTEYGLKRPLGT
ncbi:unnamed protein product [Porites lobata]|uniref:ascorbate ferrireductase (transmembrane) n=1 Tax=Porites lobata TaxID=104759 RepID=A0ABN8PH97_9CNID|nr:unnamed protein product [Porites lobata]